MIGNVNCIEIESLDHPGLEVYSRLTEAGLRGDGEIFIVESPKVISVALDSGLVPVSLLCERRHIAGQAAGIIARLDGVPVYTGDREVLAALTGYVLTRGVLCAMRRPEARSACEVCRGARRVAVLDSVVDSTNVGAVFRSAVALGVDAVLLAEELVTLCAAGVSGCRWERCFSCHGLGSTGDPMPCGRWVSGLWRWLWLIALYLLTRRCCVTRSGWLSSLATRATGYRPLLSRRPTMLSGFRWRTVLTR